MSLDPITGEVTGPPDEGGCEHCAKYKARAEVAESDLLLSENEIRQLRRGLAATQGELARRHTEAPEMRRAKALWRYYLARLEKNENRMKFGDKRQRAVVARLREGRSASYIARAIDGLAEAYFTSSSGVRFDDIELVCRNEVTLERYYAIAEQRNARTFVGPVWLQELEGEANMPKAPQIGDF